MANAREPIIYTIGHSNHPLGAFLRLLQDHAIDRVVDVRTHPYSRIAPQFQRENLALALKQAGIIYDYRGAGLGGQPQGPDGQSSGGSVDYHKRTQSPEYLRDLAHVIRTSQRQRLVLLCGEANPRQCHRHHLLARTLLEQGLAVRHILADGTLREVTWRDFLEEQLTLFELRERPLVIYTIGFAQKTAEEFFSSLAGHHVTRLVDIRLNPRTQLNGFTRQQDLPYLLSRLVAAEYWYLPLLAPPPEMLRAYRDGGDWPAYERAYRQLLEERAVAEQLSPACFAPTSCLLCSEPTPDHCHRRLAAEYLREMWSHVEIRHL